MDMRQRDRVRQYERSSTGLKMPSRIRDRELLLSYVWQELSAIWRGGKYFQGGYRLAGEPAVFLPDRG